MKVVPIPGEHRRYFVQSGSRPDVEHVVDLDYSEDQTKPGKGHAACGCEDGFIRGNQCKHIRAAMDFEKAL